MNTTHKSNMYVHFRNRDIKNNGMTKLLTVNDIAEWLQVSQRTIRDWVYRRKIPYIKVRNCLRFDPEAIRAWLEVCYGNKPLQN